MKEREILNATMENPIFLDLVEEYGDELGDCVIEITNYDVHINGALVTHLSFRDDCCNGVIAGQPGVIEFWENHFEQLHLTYDQWDTIISVVEDYLM
jgi:hypothetical protein